MKAILTIALSALMLAGCASGASHYKSASEAKAKFANDFVPVPVGTMSGIV